ncbi:neprilysin-4 [Drosophila biarmipes]|uniref:neprilysin-4 n=1 Tax=Drosophila biarmipes TaxID=125945 RepID=UPI0007E67960|nr:neprilysin-4 [Drosophila biarmipes]
MGLFRTPFLCSINLILVGLLLLVIFSLTFSDAQKVATNSGSGYLPAHADLMRSYMNLSAAPCDNLYEYACGNYKNVRTDRYSRHGYTGSLGYLLDDSAKELLGRMDLAEKLNVSRELRVAQRFYNACVAAELSPFPAADPSYLRLIRSIGGFPAVDGAAWNASSFNWLSMSAHLTNYGARGLIHEELPQIKGQQAQVYLADMGFDAIVQKDSVGSKSSHAYQVNEERMRGYLRSFKLTDDKITEVIDGVFAFWREALDAKSKKDATYTNYIYYNISSYLKIAWNEDEDRNYMKPNFNEMDKVAARHPEAAANYLALQLLYAFDAKLKDIRYQRDYCTSTMRSSMWFLFKKLYSAAYLTAEIKLDVSQIVQEVRNSLRKILEEVDWLDLRSRQMLLRMESSTRFHFDSEKAYRVNNRLIREIRRLDVVDDSYAATNINLMRYKVEINRFSTRHSLAQSTDPTSQDRLLSINPNSTPNKLRLIISADVLQPPYYHRSWPPSLKLGTLGAKLGSGITSHIVGMWTFLNKNYMKNLTQCFNDDSLPAPYFSEVFINGGLRPPLEALRNNLTKYLQKEEMLGLDLSPEQLFFLGNAQMSCSIYSNENYEYLRGLTRVKELFQAFNCPTVKTCQLW